MRPFPRWIRFAAVILVCLTLGACDTLPLRQSSPPPIEDGDVGAADIADTPPMDEGLQLALDQRFSDIPVPLNLKPNSDRTYVFENRTLQIGRMVYTSRDSVNELAQFFIRECPAADWTLDSITQASGAELVFRKPGKRLAISIRDQGVSRGRELVINMTPEAG